MQWDNKVQNGMEGYIIVCNGMDGYEMVWNDKKQNVTKANMKVQNCPEWYGLVSLFYSAMCQL